MTDSHFVQPNGDGEWEVKRSGGKKASKKFKLKKDAVDYGRTVSQNQKTELIIKKKDGTIQERDSHGNDPFPPKG